MADILAEVLSVLVCIDSVEHSVLRPVTVGHLLVFHMPLFLQNSH